MAEKIKLEDLNTAPKLFKVLTQQYKDWRPNENDDIHYQVVFKWPFPLERDTGTDLHEIVQSIFEWCEVLWKKYHLDVDKWGEEGSFFHHWNYATGGKGQLTLTLSSGMTEAISDAMGQAPYYILPTKGFSITFTTLY